MASGHDAVGREDSPHTEVTGRFSNEELVGNMLTGVLSAVCKHGGNTSKLINENVVHTLVTLCGYFLGRLAKGDADVADDELERVLKLENGIQGGVDPGLSDPVSLLTNGVWALYSLSESRRHSHRSRLVMDGALRLFVGLLPDTVAPFGARQLALLATCNYLWSEYVHHETVLTQSCLLAWCLLLVASPSGMVVLACVCVMWCRQHTEALLENHAVHAIAGIIGAGHGPTTYCATVALHHMSLSADYSSQLHDEDVLSLLQGVADPGCLDDDALQTRTPGCVVHPGTTICSPQLRYCLPAESTFTFEAAVVASVTLANVCDDDDVLDFLVHESHRLKSFVAFAVGTCALLRRMSDQHDASGRAHRRLMRNLGMTLVDSVLIMLARASAMEECVWRGVLPTWGGVRMLTVWLEPLPAGTWLTSWTQGWWLLLRRC